MATRKKARASKSAKSEKTAGEAKAVLVEADVPFEAALERLEGVVDRLEDGELELEASLEVFEEGVALSKHCAARLEDAERRVEQLVQAGGEWLTPPFDEGADEFDAMEGD
ncbi:MAG: exodeoxyribonuclease VII small subunit [Myxococcota bacterium]|jgi:exodeoxyribonuclease VII small subunit|nr:exodeoxyribonuclease VII small subunit [Myxococcota bacterium]